MGMTKEEAAKFYAEKDRLYWAREQLGLWPSDTCKACARRGGGCCQSHHHHVGDCCTHCGNDERSDDPRRWKAGPR
jgi:hypothetical protein